MSKWDEYYKSAVESGDSPPWEAADPFHGLVALADEHPDVLASGKSCIELGCGTSASAVWLMERGMATTAVDICPLALQRARERFQGSAAVKWTEMDLMKSDILNHLETYDFVFDMQCFHVLREVNEEHISRVICDLINPGGYLYVVVGAASEEQPASTFRGPPRLSEREILDPFQHRGMQVISINKSRFNMTPHYASLGQAPLCWAVLFHKPVPEVGATSH